MEALVIVPNDTHVAENMGTHYQSPGWLAELYLAIINIRSPWSKISFDAAGFIVLADLNTVARHTALTGNSSLLDVFVLCPGMHKQQNATDLNHGEYPACAAMTTGYVFRVENPATVCFLQRVGRTGHLTTLNVSELPVKSWWRGGADVFVDIENLNLWSGLAYCSSVILTLLAIMAMVRIEDMYGLAAILTLMLVRAVNVLIIRARAQVDWKGAKETELGSLMILLSQDRWIRMKGTVSDLKAVTSGQWLRDMTAVESSLVACSTMLVYLNVIVAANMKQHGKVPFILLLVCSAALLGVANLAIEATPSFTMAGRIIKADGKPRKYERRLHMAEELIKEMDRRDWAEGLGMVKPESGHYSGLPTM